MPTPTPGYQSFNDGVTCSLDADQARSQGNADGAARLDRQAIAHFENAILVEPTHSCAWASKGMSLAQLGDPAGAAEAFLQAAQIDPTMPEFFRQLGLCQIELGNIAGARQATLRAVELAADAQYARDAAIEVYNFGGYIMTAAAGHRDAGRASEERRDYQMALSVFRLALELDPHFEHARRGESVASACLHRSSP